MGTFKALTSENWRERDSTNDPFVHLDRSVGRVVETSGDDWARLFLSVVLDAGIPEEVRQLFAVARGTMVYGYYFYPLYTVGDEQLYRVADAAAVHRYEQLGGPPSERGEPPSFFHRIRWLVDHGAIPATEERRWQAYRELRNLGSHPKMQSLVMPGDALASLQLIATSVNDLFQPPVLRSVN